MTSCFAATALALLLLVPSAARADEENPVRGERAPSLGLGANAAFVPNGHGAAFVALHLGFNVIPRLAFELAGGGLPGGIGVAAGAKFYVFEGAFSPTLVARVGVAADNDGAGTFGGVGAGLEYAGRGGFFAWGDGTVIKRDYSSENDYSSSALGVLVSLGCGYRFGVGPWRKAR
jgi:hypothetical protein